MSKNGYFIISLDFELYWGVRDSKNLNEYGNNIKAVHDIIPQLLETFTNHGVKATFATVGFLFLRDKDDFKKNIPDFLPAYDNPILSPYVNHIDEIGENANVDPYHFGNELIKKISEYPEQEIASHTFSHYYCLEKGQTIESFRADLEKACEIAARNGLQLNSLVFPRNQFNTEYLKVCEKYGIRCVRGNESSWIYEAPSGGNESLFKRLCRLIDSYINITGYHCHDPLQIQNSLPVNIPASRFLRPYSRKLAIFDGLKLRRIKTAMDYAARNNLIFHLWWHPHNFGSNSTGNFLFLEKILNYYDFLNRKYGFESKTMNEMANVIIDGE